MPWAVAEEHRPVPVRPCRSATRTTRTRPICRPARTKPDHDEAAPAWRTAADNQLAPRYRRSLTSHAVEDGKKPARPERWSALERPRSWPEALPTTRSTPAPTADFPGFGTSTRGTSRTGRRASEPRRPHWDAMIRHYHLGRRADMSRPSCRFHRSWLVMWGAEGDRDSGAPSAQPALSGMCRRLACRSTGIDT